MQWRKRDNVLKKLKNDLKNNIAQKEANRELYEHYKELNAVGIGELKFKNMKVEFLLSILNEIHAMTDDALVKGVIDNAKERNHLDTLIHTRNIFGY